MQGVNKKYLQNLPAKENRPNRAVLLLSIRTRDKKKASYPVKEIGCLFSQEHVCDGLQAVCLILAYFDNLKRYFLAYIFVKPKSRASV